MLRFGLEAVETQDQGLWVETQPPQIGPDHIAFSPTVPPIATPANIPVSFEPVATDRITYISVQVMITSSTNDCHTGPLGNVAPSVA